MTEVAIREAKKSQTVVEMGSIPQAALARFIDSIMRGPVGALFMVLAGLSRV